VILVRGPAALEAAGPRADTSPVARLREEDGFGLLELLIAMVMLNVALFAIVGVFNATTVAIRRAGDVSAATAVADKQIEMYRSLSNCAIWLDQWLMPASGSAYALATANFNNITYWNAGAAANSQRWVTDGTDGTTVAAQANLHSCAWTGQGTAFSISATGLTATQGANNATTGIDSLGFITPPTNANISAVKPVQTIAGPDGVKYTVYTYIILVQPTSAEWAKQVTVVVYDPHSTRILARESAVFDPITGS
jgi:type II secretory pathway pseudopilin PulG